MGLQVNSVNLETVDGDAVTSMWIEVYCILEEKPTPTLTIQMKPYRSDVLRDEGRSPLTLYYSGQNTANEIPNYLGKIKVDLSVVQYANLDMSTIHNQLKNILELGSSYGSWNTYFPGKTWPGLGGSTVTVDLPS